MTKSELIERLKHHYALQHPKLKEAELKNISEQVVKVILTQLTQSLEKGERVEIRGFGSFSLHFRQARVGRNPKTGSQVQLEAKAVPFFKAGKALKEKVNNSL